MVVHGIFGSGANWRSFARRIVQARPEWGAVLVDLRLHGESRGAPPPHTLQTAADDLVRLVAALRDRGRRVAAVSGHSFGGKVALVYGAATEAPVQTWVLDSSPSATAHALLDPTHTVTRVLSLLEHLPTSFGDREQFVSHVVQAGQPLALARWLAMSLEQQEGGYQMRLQPTSLREILTDYFARDLWAIVENWPQTTPLQVVVGGRSEVVSLAEQQRLASCGAMVHVLPQAGHYVHVDAQADLVAHMVARLP